MLTVAKYGDLTIWQPNGNKLTEKGHTPPLATQLRPDSLLEQQGNLTDSYWVLDKHWLLFLQMTLRLGRE